MELCLSTLKFTDMLNSSYTCQNLKSFLCLGKDFYFSEDCPYITLELVSKNKKYHQ